MMAEVLLPSRQGVPAPVPASALRRPAAARRHRDGLRQPPQGDRPRRTDDRPGRDHPGARARHDPRPHEAVWGRGPVRDPRPRGGREPRRPDRRDVRRQDRRDRHQGRALPGRAAPVHPQAPLIHPRHHRRARPARHPGLGAAAGTPPPGLCLRAPLRVGRGPLPCGVPPDRGTHPAAPRALLALARGGGAGQGSRRGATREGRCLRDGGGDDHRREGRDRLLSAQGDPARHRHARVRAPVPLAGRRVRLRQDHTGALHRRPASPQDRRRHSLEREAAGARRARPLAGRAAGHPVHLPEPVQLAEPAQDHPSDPLAAAARLLRPLEERDGRPHGERPRAGRARRRPC